MNRPPLILSMPGFGSSWVYDTVSEYLLKSENVIGGYQFFNQHSKYHAYEKEGALHIKALWIFLDASNVQYCVEESRRRLELLKKYTSSVFFRLMPDQVHDEGVSWLSQNYSVISCEKRNLFEHFLGYALKKSTNKCFLPTDLKKIVPRSITYEKEYLDSYIAEYLSYMELKKKISPHITLYYEDIIANPDVNELLKNMGVFNNGKNISVNQTSPPHHEYKLNMFKDDEVILKQWKSCPLFIEDRSQRHFDLEVHL